MTRWEVTLRNPRSDTPLRVFGSCVCGSLQIAQSFVKEALLDKPWLVTYVKPWHGDFQELLYLRRIFFPEPRRKTKRGVLS